MEQNEYNTIITAISNLRNRCAMFMGDDINLPVSRAYLQGMDFIIDYVAQLLQDMEPKS